jgi:hypothetical protein
MLKTHKAKVFPLLHGGHNLAICNGCKEFFLFIYVIKSKLDWL